MLQVLEGLLRSMESQIIQEFAIVARIIWKRMNNFIFKGEFANPNTIIKEARCTLNMLNEEDTSRVTRASKACISPEV